MYSYTKYSTPACAETTSTMANIREIDIHSLDSMMNAADNIILVDIRMEQELRETGIIPGAIHIPIHELGNKLHTLMNDDREVVFYCRSGMRSAHVCSVLAMNGINNAINLKGGIIEWARHNKPLSMPARLAS